MDLTLIALLLTLLMLPHVHCLLPTRQLYQYPIGTWIENLAIRQNGSLLFTSINAPGELHSLNPFDGTEPVLVASFPGFNTTLGIVETTPDNFYLLADNYSFSGPNAGPQPGSGTVFQVDFANVSSSDGLPTVTKLVNVKEAKEFNGLTAFNDTLLLAADSALGAVWAIDTLSSSAYILSQDPLMTPVGSTDGIKLGVNGIHFRNGSLYFTNTHLFLFAKLDLDSDARPRGPATVVARALEEEGVQTTWDDFTLGYGEVAFVASAGGNAVQAIKWDGSVSNVAGSVNSTLIAQPTSAKFGRTERDSDVLYVTTAGGLGTSVIQGGVPVLVGAQIVAVDLKDHHVF